MNSIGISGNLGADSELSKLENGTSILNFSIAVDREYQKDRDNKKIDWFNCTIYGKYGESMAKHLKKGVSVIVRGEMHLEYNKEKEKLYADVSVKHLEITKWLDDSKKKVQTEIAS